MNSVLIAKIEAPGLYSSDGIVKGLRNNFEHVYEFNYQNVMFNEGAEGMRRRLMGACMMYQPDVCFLHIQNKECLDMDTIQFLSEKSFVVLYTFDVREDIQWYKDYAPYVGLILFCDYGSIDSCIMDGFENVEFLGSSADFDLYKPLPDGIKPGNNYGEIVFIGNNFLGTNLNYPLAQERVDMVNFMKENFGDIFKVYGIGWPGSRMLNQAEEIAAYRSCKIAITHNNFNRSLYTSDRLWRAMGCGAATISQYYEGYDEDMPVSSAMSWNNFETLMLRCAEMIKPSNEYFLKLIGKKQSEYVHKYHNWTTRFFKLKELILKHGYSKRVAGVPRSATN